MLRFYSGFDGDDVFRLARKLFHDYDYTYSVEPHTDVEYTEEAVTFKVDLPGIPKDQVSLSVDEGILKVEAKRGDRDVLIKRKLPTDAKADAIEASLADGVLTLKIPLEKTSALTIPIA